VLASIEYLVTGLIEAILGFFPTSPFAFLVDYVADVPELAQMISYLNWFVPVYTFVGIVEAWLAGIALYYVWQIVLRWVNAIE